MHHPAPALGDLDSRTVTDGLLAELRAGRWRPRAWGRFLAHSAARSAQQARARPAAVVEVTLLHAAFLYAARRPHRLWVATSWGLALTHLGLLGRRRSLGMANALTLTRANLPVVGDGMSRWLGVAAAGSDLIDGRLARLRGEATSFGYYADALADAAFWTWFAVRYEPSRPLRTAALVSWAVPVVAVGAASFARGRMIEAPRPALVRPAATLQALLAARALRKNPRIRSRLSFPPKRGGLPMRPSGPQWSRSQ